MQPLMPGTWWILSAYSLAHWNLLFWQLFRGLIPAYVPCANKSVFFQLLHLVQSIRVCCYLCVPTTSFSLCIGQYLLALKCSYPNLLQQGWTISVFQKGKSHSRSPGAGELGEGPLLCCLPTVSASAMQGTVAWVRHFKVLSSSKADRFPKGIKGCHSSRKGFRKSAPTENCEGLDGAVVLALAFPMAEVTASFWALSFPSPCCTFLENKYFLLQGIFPFIGFTCCYLFFFC